MKFVPALAALLALPVLAGTNVPPGQGGTVCQGSTCGGDGGSGTTPQVTIVDVDVTGKTTVSNVSRSASNSASFAQGGAGGNASATGGTSSSNSRATGGRASASAVGSVSQNVNFVAPKIPNNTPDTALAVPPATSPCRIAVGAGGSGPGLGVMLGFSTLDEGCDAREDARTLWAVGLQGAAYSRLCQKPEMAKAMGALCQREEQTPTPVSSTDFGH